MLLYRGVIGYCRQPLMGVVSSLLVESVLFWGQRFAFETACLSMVVTFGNHRARLQWHAFLCVRNQLSRSMAL